MRYFIIVQVFAYIFLSQSLYSQQEDRNARILFRGVVLSASSGERLPGSKVFINSSLSGLSRDDGTFSFFAHRYDTIVFNQLGYKSSRFIVRDTLRTNEFLTGIFLESDTLQIGEVVILPAFSSLRADMRNPGIIADQKLENARSNLEIASYQGRVSAGKLGDPYTNYELVRNQHMIDAIEKGGIPSSRMVGISPLLIIPAVYLLVKGAPEKPMPPGPGISQKELNEINKRYKELLDRKYR